MKRFQRVSLLVIFFTTFNLLFCVPAGVMYTLSNGRFGDNILAYAHAAYIAHTHDLPLYYTSFAYSNQLALHINKQAAPRHISSKDAIFITDGCLSKVKKNILYVVRYYSEYLGLYDSVVTDPVFEQKVKEDIKPIKLIPSLNLPIDCITVAVHVRKSGCKWDGYCKPNPNQFYTQEDLNNAVGKELPPKKYADQFWPLKFPPDQYYIDQLKALSELLDDPPLYVYLFTDYPDPQSLVEKYMYYLNKPNVEFSCRKKGNSHDRNVLEDFFAMAQQFDCFIRSGSNFGWAAQFIGNHKIVFTADHARWVGDILTVDKASIVIRDGNQFKRMSVEDVTKQDLLMHASKDILDKAALSHFTPIPIKEMNLEQFYNDMQPRTYLLSFPISGNTWLRYCIEFLTKRPTLQKYHSIDYVAKIEKNVNCPLGYTFDLGTDMSLPCIWKVHDLGYLQSFGDCDPKSETLIFLLRNPKEVLLRNYCGDAKQFNTFFEQHHGKDLLSQKDLKSAKFASYFQGLRIYDGWNSEKRLLIHYEDLIMRPRAVFYRLLSFLGCDDRYIDSFFQDYDNHKKRVLSIYNKQLPGSVSGGNDILCYSKQIDPIERKRMDKTIEKAYPRLWHVYLKVRYSEEVLYEQNLYD